MLAPSRRSVTRGDARRPARGGARPRIEARSPRRPAPGGRARPASRPPSRSRCGRSRCSLLEWWTRIVRVVRKLWRRPVQPAFYVRIACNRLEKAPMDNGCTAAVTPNCCAICRIRPARDPRVCRDGEAERLAREAVHLVPAESSSCERTSWWAWPRFSQRAETRPPRRRDRRGDRALRPQGERRLRRSRPFV